LANRKSKGHGVRSADPLFESSVNRRMGVEEEDGSTEEVNSFVFGDDGKTLRNDARGNQRKFGTIKAGSKLKYLNPPEYQEVTDSWHSGGLRSFNLLPALMILWPGRMSCH
jgi:hypothetical protein